ncbi:mechanosensitive ion channel family protein [Desulforudis sp. 1088]|uniref:mechanosensitive ion channel family protein n=1 Tax=unclassified Candidatus Desulforudis TaxID=2635950 RepID=UPI003CE4EE4D
MGSPESIFGGFNPTEAARSAFTIIVIILAAWAGLFIARKLIARAFDFSHGAAGRKRTLAGIVYSLVRYTVYIVAGLMIFQVLFPRVNLGPVLAGAGVVGLAVGLGLQTFLKDVITGFLVNFEDQFRVGDYVTINDVVSGTVEDVGLRLTTVREWSGKKFYIANSEIKTVRNFNREELRVIVSVTFPFEEDPLRIREALEEVSRTIGARYNEDLLRDEGGNALEPPHVLGVTDIDENGRGGQYTIVARVKPRKYWEIQRAIREEIWLEARERGIRLAYPRFTVDEYPAAALPHKSTMPQEQ